MNTTEAPTRLVNAYMVRRDPRTTLYDFVSEGCGGNPLAMLGAARKSPFGVGVLIVDVHTDERWFVPA